MRIRLLLILAAFLPNPVAAIPEINAWATPNGVRILFVRAVELPIVDIRVVFDAGSARDGAKSGLAVLTNGVLTEGAGGLSAERISERFEELGAHLGNGADRDMAWISLRSIIEPSSLEPALAALALVLEHPDFPEDAFERERRRMLVALKGRQQNPAQLAEDAFYAKLYGAHPYASPPHGTEKILVALKRADL